MVRIDVEYGGRGYTREDSYMPIQIGHRPDHGFDEPLGSTVRRSRKSAVKWRRADKSASTFLTNADPAFREESGLVPTPPI